MIGVVRGGMYATVIGGSGTGKASMVGVNWLSTSGLTLAMVSCC